MNIDELVNSIQQVALRGQLFQWVKEWKDAKADVEDLSKMLLKWHGNVWFQNKGESTEFLNQLNDFNVNAIDGLSELTLNERLYWFGLFEYWDCSDENDQNIIRRKLHANA